MIKKRFLATALSGVLALPCLGRMCEVKKQANRMVAQKQKKWNYP